MLRERDVKASPEAAAPSRATGAHSVRGRAASRSPRQQSVLSCVPPQKQHVCVTVSTKLAQLWVDRVCLRGVRGYGITVITVHQRS